MHKHNLDLTVNFNFTLLYFIEIEEPASAHSWPETGQQRVSAGCVHCHVLVLTFITLIWRRYYLTSERNAM